MLVMGGVFSGVGGFELAARRCGIRTAWSSELDPRCRSILRRHFPEAKHFGDIRAVRAALEKRNAGRTTIEPLRRIDILCGGFPCQDVSLAGLRAGLAGERTGLYWELRRTIGIIRPRWVVLENVPGLLSSNAGRDMRAITRSLEGMGYQWAYRILDSRWFNVPQRRRRVFIVGHLGPRFGSAARCLFDAACLPWDSPALEASQKDVAGTLESGAGRRRGSGVNPGSIVNAVTRNIGAGGASDNTAQAGHLIAFDARNQSLTGDTSCAIQAKYGTSLNSGPLLAPPITGNPYGDNASREGLLVPIAFSSKDNGQDASDLSPTLRSMSHSHSHANGGGQVAIAFCPTQITSDVNRSNPQPGDPCHTLNAGAKPPGIFTFQPRIARCDRGGPSDVVPSLSAAETGVHGDSQPHVAGSFGVRRLLPVECERLQSFPDNWSRWGHKNQEFSNSFRYRCMGNAVTVNVIEWVFCRLLLEDASHV